LINGTHTTLRCDQLPSYTSVSTIPVLTMLTRQTFVSCFVVLNLVMVLRVESVFAETAVLHYQQDSTINAEVTIQDSSGTLLHLLDLVRSQDKSLSVIYIFGGGAMGAESIKRGIWCQDSYEDLHILRSLVNSYSEDVAFIAIAEPPVFHTRQMGFQERALLDFPQDSDTYQTAYQAFIESTQTAVDRGLIPIEPYLDMGFQLLMSDTQQSRLNESYGVVPDWQGAFRAPDEEQMYGVPAFWIVDENGKVLEQPFRGNIYHPHGDDGMRLNYSLQDLVVTIDKHLGDRATTDVD